MASKKKPKNQKRIGVLPASLIFDLARARVTKFKAFGVTVTLKYERISIMAKNPKCDWPGCSRRISYFLIATSNTGHYYCQPYSHSPNTAEQDQLMNIDHTIARCLGGKDEPSNMTTMCKTHNPGKGKIEDYLRSKGVVCTYGNLASVDVQ